MTVSAPGNSPRDRFLLCVTLFDQDALTTVLVDREGRKCQAVIGEGDAGRIGVVVPLELQAEMEKGVRDAIAKLRLLPADQLSRGRR